MQPLSELISKRSAHKIARLISTLFIPPTVMLFSFFYLGVQYGTSFQEKAAVICSAFLFTFLLPILFFLIMLKKQKIVNQDAELKEERTVPFLFGLFLLIAGYFILQSFGVQKLILVFWFSFITNSIAIILINKVWKISIHAFGLAAPLALFAFWGSWIALPVLLFLLLVGWSRIYLKCHNFAQVFAGASFGFISVYGQLYFILK